MVPDTLLLPPGSSWQADGVSTDPVAAYRLDFLLLVESRFRLHGKELLEL